MGCRCTFDSTIVNTVTASSFIHNQKLCIKLTHSHTLSLSPLTHSHTHHTHTLSLSLSLTHTHTHSLSTHTHSHSLSLNTHTHSTVRFCEKWGHPIGVMVFILYKLYVLLPYTNPTPTLYLNLASQGDCAFQLSPKKNLTLYDL